MHKCTFWTLNRNHESDSTITRINSTTVFVDILFYPYVHYKYTTCTYMSLYNRRSWSLFLMTYWIVTKIKGLYSKWLDNTFLEYWTKKIFLNGLSKLIFHNYTARGHCCFTNWKWSHLLKYFCRMKIGNKICVTRGAPPGVNEYRTPTVFFYFLGSLDYH